MRSILKAALCEIGIKGIYELPIDIPMEGFYSGIWFNTGKHACFRLASAQTT
jgi:hypothetical protein